MEFTLKIGDCAKQRCACCVVGVYSGHTLTPSAEQLDKVSKKYISNLLKRGDFEGSLGATLLLHYLPNAHCERVLLVGLGDLKKTLVPSDFQKICRNTFSALQKTGAKDCVTTLAELSVDNYSIEWKIKQIILAHNAVFYTFDNYQSKKQPTPKLKKTILLLDKKKDLASATDGLNIASAMATGQNLTKELANLPPNICTPEYLAKTAKKLAKEYKSISVAVLNEIQMQALNMNALLAVAKGSDLPPKLITLSYKGAPKKQKPIVLVGKGVTFDTGGNSLKPANSMEGMKYDMCGAATVIGVLKACALLALPLNVIGVIPAVENSPGGRAYRPDDIIKTMSGQTVEVLNTDAEGRLILCDALTYSERYKPECVIDMATLTGACIVALGRHPSALYSNHSALSDDLLSAGEKTFDRAWPMPLWVEYESQLTSNAADMTNIGGPEAGSITAASFLSKFAKKFKWAHLDIAGTASTRWKGRDRAATGRPVPLIVQYLVDKADHAG